MSIVIKYNDIELKYPATVSVTTDYIDYGSRWGAIQKISIQGNIVNTSCNNDLTSQYSNLISAQTTLFSLFQNDFKSLKVDSEEIKNCKLDSIDFQESNYYGAIGFTVNLTAYPDTYFTTNSVTDPVNTITYSEQRNNSLQVTHKISAKGINTSTSGASNALENARNYINARVGESSFPSVSKITGGTYSSLTTIKPKKIVETIDRMNASISVEKVYLIKSGQTGDSTLFYTVDSNYDDEKGVITGTIKGNISGPISTSMDSLRSSLKNINFFSLLNTYFQAIGVKTALVNQPDSMSINENSKEKTIDFSYACSSIPSSVKTFSKTFSMSNDYITDKVTINFTGKVEFRGGQKQRQTAASNFQFTADAAQALCSAFYTENSVDKFGKKATINAVPTTFEIKRDLINGVVTITAACDNRPNPPDARFTSFDYTLSANASAHYFTTAYFLDGGTSGLDYRIKTRGEISIQGNATAKISGLESACISMAQNLLTQARDAVGGLTDELLVEAKVESTDKPDDSGYIYTVTVTKTGLTTKTTKDWGASN
jgi:hypothetical protein